MTRTKQHRALPVALALALATAILGPAAALATTTSLDITNVWCVSNGASPNGEGTGACSATVTGGTGTYSYTWEPQPIFTTNGGSWARIPCTLGYYQNVWLTVTDSGGATDTFSTGFFCGEAH